MLDRQQFVDKATGGDYVPYNNPGQWAMEAAALSGALALKGSELPHEVVVEAIQKLALRMPGVMVMASTAKLAEVCEDYVL